MKYVRSTLGFLELEDTKEVESLAYRSADINTLHKQLLTERFQSCPVVDPPCK